MPLTLDAIRALLPPDGLFGGGEWKWSPEPLRLSAAEVRQISSLGHPLAQFQKACNQLYRRSAAGKEPAWIAELLDAGKPTWLVDVQRDPALADELPRVIRPDLLLTERGFSMTELDSVPGGIGICAWLSQLYAQAGFEVLGGKDGMLDGFRQLMPDGGEVLVSEESGDYRPEMAWLCNQLGEAWSVVSAEEFQPSAGNLYRFFELFDWESIAEIRQLVAAVKSGHHTLTPPFKPHLEDKLWLALLWSPALKSTWRQMMRGSHLKRVHGVVPFGWVLDPQPLPPHAALPRMDAHSWQEVGEFSQKERQLVLKVSGFHETAWGARGVFIGHDLSQPEWQNRLNAALDQADEQPWILQEFHEARRIEHPIFRPDGSIKMMQGRARVCPYYFINDAGQTILGGCMATIVPADKKKIHGMSDGILVPCMLDESAR